MFDALVPIVFFAFLGAVILVPQVLKSRDRQRMYETMRAAYERGQPMPPEFIDAMTRRPRDASVDPGAYPDAIATPAFEASDRDLRRGVVWLAVGIGLVLVGAAFYAGLYSEGGASETFGTFAALGAIPACVGVAYIGLWYFTRRKPRAN